VSVLLALAILFVGAIARVPGIVAVGVVLVAIAVARSAWTRAGSAIVAYQRGLTTDRAVCGDEIELAVSVHNRGPLPLPWVKTSDGLGRGVRVRHRLQPGEEPRTGTLDNGWTLGPFEKIVRRFGILADRRGVFELGPMTVAAGDALGLSLPVHEEPAKTQYVVRPRMVAVKGLGEARDWEGLRRARHGLVEDATRFAGVRPYRPGDAIRHIHWPATARAGQPVTKRFDPSRRRDVLLAVDLRLPRRPGMTLAERDARLEGLIVTTMSIARAMREDDAAVGLALAGFGGQAGRSHLFLPPNATGACLGLIGDILARVDAVPAVPFAQILGLASRRIPPGTTVITIGAVDPIDYLPALRQLRRLGFGVLHVAFGGDDSEAVERVRAAGIPARTAELNGPWATSTALELSA
jgi:uncharacterized protein (DUF58 family)